MLIRRVICLLRSAPGPGVQSKPREAVVDTGAPLTIFPHHVWFKDFGWELGRDYEDVSVAGGKPTFLPGQVVGYRTLYRLVRLKAAVELVGKNPPDGLLRLESLVAQLEEPPTAARANAATGLPRIILGLWGNALNGRAIRIGNQPNSDDLFAQLEF